MTTKIFIFKSMKKAHIIFTLQWRLDPLSTKISFENSNFLIFCAFLHILHVYDFFINVLINWAVRKRIYKIFGFNGITKIHFGFFQQSFNFYFDICTSVASWLDKITHLLCDNWIIMVNRTDFCNTQLLCNKGAYIIIFNLAWVYSSSL